MDKAMRFRSRHLLALEGMPKEDILAVLETAFSFKKVLLINNPALDYDSCLGLCTIVSSP